MPTHPVEQVGTSVNKAQRRPRRAREKSSPKGRRTPAPTPWRSSARHHQSGRLETFFKIPDQFKIQFKIPDDTTVMLA
jgi:hypothetical protein